jgi:hypothetical protein
MIRAAVCLRPLIQKALIGTEEIVSSFAAPISMPLHLENNLWSSE